MSDRELWTEISMRKPWRKLKRPGLDDSYLVTLSILIISFSERRDEILLPNMTAGGRMALSSMTGRILSSTSTTRRTGTGSSTIIGCPRLSPGELFVLLEDGHHAPKSSHRDEHKVKDQGKC